MTDTFWHTPHTIREATAFMETSRWRAAREVQRLVREGYLEAVGVERGVRGAPSTLYLKAGQPLPYSVLPLPSRPSRAAAPLPVTSFWARPRTLAQFAQELGVPVGKARVRLQSLLKYRCVHKVGNLVGGRGYEAPLYLATSVECTAAMLKDAGGVDLDKELQAVYRVPATTGWYESVTGAASLTARSRARSAVERGLLFFAGWYYPRRGRPAPLYCSDAGEARRSIFKTLAQRYKARKTDEKE